MRVGPLLRFESEAYCVKELSEDCTSISNRNAYPAVLSCERSRPRMERDRLTHTTSPAENGWSGTKVTRRPPFDEA